MTPTKQTARLTAETARAGMRVRCVESYEGSTAQLEKGVVYTITQAGPALVRLSETGDWWFSVKRFIPINSKPDQPLRAILAERAPDLLAALVAITSEARRVTADGEYVGPFTERLIEEIERANLLAEPSQPALLPAMWCGADAFTQENDDGR